MQIICDFFYKGSNKLQLDSGSSYTYAYNADVRSSLGGDEHSSLHMTASVEIHVLSKCELALKVTNHFNLPSVQIRNKNSARLYLIGLWLY